MSVKISIVVLVVSLLCFSSVSAGDFLALQGNVDQSGVALSSGNLQVVIYDAQSGGSIIYNSSSDFNGAVSGGKYDVVLGNGSQVLNLNYGRKYFLELYVNGEKFTFNGLTRQPIQSSVGNVTFDSLSGSNTLVFLNQSNTFTAGQNVSTSGGGWFKGMFEWFTNSGLLSFNGTTLSFNEAALNSTIDARSSGFNETNYINTQISNNNASWTSTFNSTYALFAYNQTGVFGYNQTEYTKAQVNSAVNGNTTNITTKAYVNTNIAANFTDFYTANSTFWYNQTNMTWLYNQTVFNNSFYNSTYALFAYNQTGIFGYNQTVYSKAQIDSAINGNSSNLTTKAYVNTNINSNTSIKANLSGGNVFTGQQTFDGDFGAGGVRISGGDIFAQQLYVYNVTSLSLSNLAINASTLPTQGFDATFDIGNESLRWRDLHISRNIFSNGSVQGATLYAGGNLVNTWLYNQTVFNNSFYNSTYATFAYNQTGVFGYNQTIYSKAQIASIVNGNSSNLTTKAYVNTNIAANLTDFYTQNSTFWYNQTEFTRSQVNGIINGNVSNITSGGSSPWAFSTNLIYNDTANTNLSIGTAKGGSTLNVIGTLNITNTSTAAATQGLYNDQNGKVGIGTATPKQTLDVVGNISARGTINASDEIYVKNSTAVSTFLYNQTVYSKAQIDSAINGNSSNLTTKAYVSSSINANLTDFYTANSTFWYNQTIYSKAQIASIVNGNSSNLTTNAYVGTSINANLSSFTATNGTFWYNQTEVSKAYVASAVNGNTSNLTTNAYVGTSINANLSSFTTTNGTFWYNQTLPSGWNLSSTNVILRIPTYRVGIGIDTPGSALHVSGGNVTFNTSTTAGVTYDAANQRLGIGMISPLQSLDVIGDADIRGNDIVTGTLNLGTTSTSGGVQIGDGGLCVGDGGCTIPTTDGNVLFAGDLDVAGGDITTGTIHFGTTSTSGLYEFEDSSVCVGDAGCTASSTDGRLLVEEAINAGDATPDDVAYNKFGSGTPNSGQVTDGNDAYVTDDLEVDGTFYLVGGYTAIVNGDVAEVLITKNGRDHILCEQNSSCIVETYNKELDYGDVVCIDTRYGQVIRKCDANNSKLVVGVVSNTSKINMGNNLKYGYPIAVAGIVFTKVSAENGPISPGDLLVSGNEPGYAMKNNNARAATILGKAYDFCDSGECNIPMFVSLS